jgi:hypothetical protein
VHWSSIRRAVSIGRPSEIELYCDASQIQSPASLRSPGDASSR